MTDSYIAVTRGTSNAGGYAGVMTWSDWGTKEAFDAFMSSQNEQELVEEGITEERAVQLTRATPRSCYIEAALEEATGPDGSVHPEVLRFKLLALG